MKTVFIFLVFVQVAQAALSPAEAFNLLRSKGREATTVQTRREVSSVLKSITLSEVQELEGYTMTEVIAFLDSKIKKHNSKINLIINPNLNQTNLNIVNPVAPVVQIDPVTGLPLQEQIPPNINNNQIKIFNPDDIKVVGLKNKLRNLNILQLIEVVTQSFDTPVQYSLTEYGVVFFSKPADQAGVFSRMLKINPNTLNNAPPTLGGSNKKQDPLNNSSRMSKGVLNIFK